MKLRQVWFIAEFLGILNMATHYKKSTVEWMRIQTAKVWLKGVSVTRELVIYQVGILACVIVLVFSVMMLEVAILFCIPISLGMRAIIVLVIGAINFSVALGFLGYFLSPERWLERAAKYNTCLAEILKSENIFKKAGINKIKNEGKK